MKLNTDDVKLIAEQCGANNPCNSCSIFASLGWESFPNSANDSNLIMSGSLWLAGEEEPTLAEHHPDGTNYWSTSAPIALNFHPYNRCEIWKCRQCGHPFLRYTEYGGYYEDQRIRELNSALIV